MDLWHLNVGDVSVLESIMPDDPRIFRMFGNYLGARSLALKDRHRMLSRADHLEFEIQKNLLADGYRELNRSNWGEAKMRFGWCLGNLPKIRFFHKISGLYPLVDSEFQRLAASANLGFARSILESGGKLEEARDYIQTFLDLEDDENSLEEFESFLLRSETSDSDIRLHLYHKQGRYQEIVDVAGQIRRALSARSLYIIGDAYRKLGKQQDAEVFFDRSVEKDTKILQILIPIREFYRNLNKNDKIPTINDMIEKVVVSNEMNFNDFVINKEKEYSWQLSFDKEDINIFLYFMRTDADHDPLVTIEFNREVVWDDYLEEESFSIPVKAVVGENILHISTTNYPVILKKISYIFR